MSPVASCAASVGVFNVAKNIVAKMKKFGVFGFEKQKEEEDAKNAKEGNSSDDEEKMVKEYYEKSQKRGSWRPKAGAEGWMMSGTTFRLAE